MIILWSYYVKSNRDYGILFLSQTLPRESHGHGCWIHSLDKGHALEKNASLKGDSLILLLGRFSAMRFGHPLSQFPDSQTMMQQLYKLIPNVQLQSWAKAVISRSLVFPFNPQCSTHWSQSAARVFPARLHLRFSDASGTLPVPYRRCTNRAAQILLLQLDLDSYTQS